MNRHPCKPSGPNLQKPSNQGYQELGLRVPCVHCEWPCSFYSPCIFNHKQATLRRSSRMPAASPRRLSPTTKLAIIHDQETQASRAQPQYTYTPPHTVQNLADFTQGSALQAAMLKCLCPLTATHKRRLHAPSTPLQLWHGVQRQCHSNTKSW